MESVNEKLNPNPKWKANWLSSLFFTYTIDIFQKGCTNSWNANNLYSPINSHRSKLLGRVIEREWNRTFVRCKIKGRKPSLYKVIFKIFWSDILYDGCLLVLVQLLKIPEPFLLRSFLTYFSQNSRVTKEEALWFIIVLTCMNGVRSIVFIKYKLSCQETALKIRASCGSLIQKKVLRMSKSAMENKGAENIANLLSNDLNRFDQPILFVHYIWVTPVSVLSTLYLLYIDAGIPGMVGVVWYTLTMFLQSYTAKLIGSYRTKISEKTDVRLKFMNEMLTGIRVIKMYAWENTFSKFIESARISELRIIKKASYLKSIIPSFLMFVNTSAILVGILTTIQMGESISAAKVYSFVVYYTYFSSIICFSYPLAISKVVELYHVFKRLDTFMLGEEVKSKRNRECVSGTTKIEFKNVFAQWSAEEEIETQGNEETQCIKKGQHLFFDNEVTDYILKDMSFTLGGNDFMGIVGPVGSGKSSLLFTILGETVISSGTRSVQGSISYASQEPWIFQGTIKQNILFDQTFDESRYLEVIRVCGLERDLELLPKADLTLVGERGSCLSGGQKTRINLARAVYKEADIYLLDDPLSSLDIHVSRYLRKECFEKFLSNKCRILVTHQFQHLESCTSIIVLNLGTEECRGSFDEIKRQIGIFNIPVTNKNSRDLSNGVMENLSESVQEPNRRNEVEQPQNVTEAKDKIYKSYILAYLQSGCKIQFITLVILMFIICQITESGIYIFLGYWSHNEEMRNHSNLTYSLSDEDFKDSNREIYVFGGLLAALGIFSLLKGILYCQMVTRNSRDLHKKMLGKVVRGKMNFFDQTTSGQILSRFLKDLGVVDEILPRTLMETIVQGLGILAKLLIVGYTNPYLLIIIVILVLLLPFFAKIFQKTAKSLSRVEGSLMAPILAHLNATIKGLTTIRSAGAESVITDEFDVHQDRYMTSWYMYCTALNAFGFTVDFISFLFIAIVTFSCFFMKDLVGLNGGQIGLAITQAMGLSSFLQFGIMQFVQTDNCLVAVERILEYDNIPQEPETFSSITLPNEWPSRGKITFKNVEVKYDNALPVLRNLNFTIRPREKIGIVGRTGAGKSSIVAALFRMVSITGKIEIDEYDTSTIPLETLRSHISIIPQDSVLFSGTLRYNLDPFEEFDDSELYKALREIDWEKTMNSVNSLQDVIGNNGSNLSIGQKQLINLTRAILKKKRILLLDEATSNLDAQTDHLIQTTIRRIFADCTVLTVAHRLSTIMDSDRIMVLEAGEIVEFNKPDILLQNTEGIFYAMVNAKKVEHIE